MEALPLSIASTYSSGKPAGAEVSREIEISPGSITRIISITRHEYLLPVEIDKRRLIALKDGKIHFIDDTSILEPQRDRFIQITMNFEKKSHY